MFQAPTTEAKADPQRAGLRECALERPSAQRAPAVRGNQAILNGLAIQRATDTTAVSVDGEKLPGLSSAPSGGGEAADVDAPDTTLDNGENGSNLVVDRNDDVDRRPEGHQTLGGTSRWGWCRDGHGGRSSSVGGDAP